MATQIALDEDWSALRFRRAEIKKLTRKSALSAAGKARVRSRAAGAAPKAKPRAKPAPHR